MCILARVGIGRVIAVVRGDQLQTVEDFQGVRVIDDVYALTYVLFRHAVMMLEERDVAVLQHRIRPALLHLKPDGGKRLQVVALRLLEKFPAGLVASGQPPFIETSQRLAYGRVQGVHVVEHQSLYVNVDGAVHQFHGVLHQRLVLGMAHAGRIHGTAVMLGKCGKVLVDNRLVTVTACHCRLQVVRHDGHRHTAEEMQRVLA